MMHRLFHLLVLIALLACEGTVRAAYDLDIGNTDPASGIRAKAMFPFEQVPSTGFCPVHLKIQNHTNSGHTWTLEFTHTDNMFGFQNPTTVVWRTEVSVPAGKTGEWDLFIPLAGLNSTQSGYVNVSGRITGYAIRNERFSAPSRYSGGVPTPYVLISEQLSDPVWSKLETELKKPSSKALPSFGNGYRFSRLSGTGGWSLDGSNIELKKLPPDWRALSGVSGLWITAAEWPSLSADRRRAIRQWITGGGHLFVASAEGASVKLSELPELPKEGQPVALGMGKVEGVKLENGELPIDKTASSILDLWDGAFPVWNNDHRDWSLVQSLGWPKMSVKLIVLFVSLFAVVIGPINFRVFAPPSRRYRLFFTVPALSAIASVLLFGVIALGDGFGGTGFRNALVYLPAGENTATISQEQISRARLLVGRAFNVPDEAQVSLVRLRDDNQGRISLERSGSFAGGDWFRSRAVQGQLLRTIVPTRAEVVIQNPQAAPGEQPVILSSVAGLLKDFVYVDASGQHWAAPEVPTGTPVKLAKVLPSQWAPWIRQNTEGFSPHLTEAMKGISKRPGYFYAVAETLPEAPIKTLEGIKWTDKIVCFGPCVKGDVK